MGKEDNLVYKNCEKVYNKNMRRFFGEKQDDKIIVKGDEFFHLKKVLRMGVGDDLICYVNDENEYECKIDSMEKDFCECQITKVEKCKAIPKKNITLFQMMPKRDYFDSILPKAIELGVSEIYFFTSEFTILKSFKRERVESQIESACKQCERSKKIVVNDMIDFDLMLKKLGEYEIVVFAYEDETNSFDWQTLSSYNNIAVVIGNEAGFSDDEANKIKQVSIVKSVSLGTRILRCDTAVVATLSLVGVMSKN